MPTGPVAWGWEHTSLSVADLDQALAFYQAAFGYEVIFQERGMTTQIQQITGLPGLRCDLAQLRSPLSGHLLELIAFHDGPPDREEHAPTRVGAAHVAFKVRDLDAAVEAMRHLGAEMIGEITQFEEGRSAYLREPSGTVVELDESQPEEESFVEDGGAP